MATKLTDKAWLEEQYVIQHKPATIIAMELGVAKNSVYRALERHGIATRRRTSRYPILDDRNWLYEQYITQKRSLNNIAKEVGCTVGVVHSHLIAKGIPTRPSREASVVYGYRKRTGEKAANWRGGRRILKTGYIYIYNPNHPHATKAGYIFEHRLVMEKMIGKYLDMSEIVHHIDGNKSNNDPSNLELKKNGLHITDHFQAGHEVIALRKRVAQLEAELAECRQNRPASR